MKKRFFCLNKIAGFLILFLCVQILSCNVLWNADLREEIDLEPLVKIHFYSDKEEALAAGTTLFTTTRNYPVGKTISAADLPAADDAEISKWKPDFRLGGWKYYRWTATKQEISDSSMISSMKVSANEVDLYAVWFAKYTVIYKYQNSDGSAYEENTEIRYGEPGTEATVNPPVKTGFENPVFSNAVIADNGTTEIIVTYNRKTVTIILEANGGTISETGGTSGSNLTFNGLYGAPFDKKGSITIDPVNVNFSFIRWNPELPDIFPAEDTTYTAIYKGQEFKITYHDVNFAGSDIDFSGKNNSLPDVYEYGKSTKIPSSVSSVSSDENTVEFAGWFKDAAATKELDKDADGSYCLSATTCGELSLYAKWKAKYIYVDPQSSFNGKDSNNGLTSSTPLKTIAEVKKYLSGGAVLDSPAVRVLSEISGYDDLMELDGLTTAAYGNAILQRSSKKTGDALLTVNGSYSLSNITIDGGSGYSAADTPIVVLSSGDLTLGSGTRIQNFKISNSSVKGLIDLSYGGSLILEGAVITENSVAGGYSVYSSNPASALQIQGETEIALATPVYLGSACQIKITGELTKNPVAKVHSIEYASMPQVLTEDSGGNLVKNNYNKFVSAHNGFSINENGYFVTSADLGIDFSDPQIKVLQLGNLVDYTGSVSITGSSTVDFKVKDDSYAYIEDSSGEKKIQVAVLGNDGTVLLTNSAAVDASTHVASLELVTDASGNRAVSEGCWQVIVYAVSGKNYVYFERVTCDVLVLP